MADTYREDDSIAPEHAAAEIGEKISWGARAIDGIGGVAGVFTLPGWLGLLNGPATFLAPAVAVGEGLKVVDDVSHGDMKKAGKHMVVGASKAGVVFLDGMTMGLMEIPSLLFTGKFLSTNVGDVVGQMLDGADKNAPTTSTVASVGFTNPAYAMAAPPPTDARQVVQDNTPPYGMQAPEGGWRNYVMARRNAGMVQQEEMQSVTSGNPTWTRAVEVAQNAAGTPQLNS